MIQEKIQSFPSEDFPLYEEEVVESNEGSLIDHYLTVNKNRQYHVYQETYLNCWTSCWLRLSGTEEEMWDYWYKFIERGEQDEY